MGYTSKSRREFIRNLCCVAAGGGAAAMIPQLRMMGTALASTSALSGYKALVCIYLNGGNDSWNMLVPFDTPRFNIYKDARSGLYSQSSTGLALDLPTGTNVAAQKIVDIADNNANTQQYFLHPSMADASAGAPTNLVKLFNQGHLAFTVNVGTLVKPIQMSDYSNAANRPPQLYSHSDQTAQWHQANTSTTSAVGWGGKLAENLASQGANTSSSPSVPLAISVAGTNRFEIGASTVPYQISSNGLTSLSGVCNPNCTGVASNSGRDAALNAILQETYQNDFTSSYQQIFQNGRDLYAKISPGLSTATLPLTFRNTNGNTLGAQLQTVAKMIKVSTDPANNYASRQIYFVSLGGFDMHSGLMSGHPGLLTTLTQAMSDFYTCMVQLGLQNSVTMFTTSDFARTLQSNGSGSDHAWGSVQMVLGGSVQGGRLFSDGGGPIKGFPDQDLNATNNFARGQMIPGIGVEQYAATLAYWMGVSMSNLNTMFPNLHNFSKNNLLFI